MINAFEGVRGLAALLVALYHLNIGRANFAILRHAYIFVDLFFVLSGFVICAAYTRRLNNTGEFSSFVIRRFGRLFPLLVFSTAFYVLAANIIVAMKRLAINHGYAASLGTPDAIAYLVPSNLELITTLTFSHSLGIFDKLILNTPTWSISTEFYTYLLFATACLLFKGRLRLLVFSIFILVAFAVTTWASITLYNCLDIGSCNTQTFDFGFARCVLSFFLGALTQHFGKTIQFEARKLQLPAIGLLMIYFWNIDHIPALSFLPPYLFAFLILSLMQDRGMVAWLLNLRTCQILGQRSYSIYLMHLPLALFFELIANRLDGAIPRAVLVGIYTITVYIVSGWTFKYIEDPFRIMFNRMSDHSRYASSGDRREYAAEALVTPARIPDPEQALPMPDAIPASEKLVE